MNIPSIYLVNYLNLFGSGTVFPVGVETHEFWIEYEMII